jgi:hypothetical protein
MHWMKLSQRVIGWGAVGFGAVCVFVGAMPFFAGIHWEGILLGLGSFGAGAWVLAGPELRATIRKGFAAMKESGRIPGSRGRSRERRRPASVTGIDPLLPVRILKLAKEHNGILSVADVAMGLEVPLDHAEAGIAECVRAGNAFADYDIARAHAVYRFPEFLPPDPLKITR